MNAGATFFDALGRSAHLADWQFRQAIDAVGILACEVLVLPWAADFAWRSLADQARSLEPHHRTFGRESTKVRAQHPTVAGARGSTPSPEHPATSTSETESEVARIIEALRPSIRLAGLAYATEQTYIHWCVRFTKFSMTILKQAPQDAGTQALTAYLNYLALERNVSASTQKQALNALVFLTRKVFGVEEFTLLTPKRHGHPHRSGSPRPRRHLHHHDLPAPPQAPRSRWTQSA